jgi:hypothetical protein
MGFRIIGGVAATPAPAATNLDCIYGTFGLLQNVEHVIGTTGTPSGGPTSGSEDSLGVASRDLDGIELMLDVATSGRPVMIDLIVGGVTVVYRLPLSNVSFVTRRVRLPIRILQGQTVQINALSVAAATYVVSAIGYYNDGGSGQSFSSLRNLNTLGSSLATSGSIVNLSSASNGWVSVSAGLPSQIRGISIYAGNNQLASARTPGRFYLDIGTGDSGAETVLIPRIQGYQTASAVGIASETDAFMVDLPAGSKLWVRHDNSVGGPFSSPGNDVLNIMLCGFFP